jgi:tetratricopeptide (TPR) repeat protein
MARFPRSRRHAFGLFAAIGAAMLLPACAGAPSPARAPSAPIRIERTDTQIITPEASASRQELVSRAKGALLEGRWQDAVTALEMLRAAGSFDDNGEADAPTLLFDLGLAYEGLGEREKARDLYHEVGARFPDSANARTALLREAMMHADLEEWARLGETADALLKRADLDAVDHMSAVGARALSHVELGDDASAMREVQGGLDEMETLGFGATGKLPPAAAQLRFTLAEVRRVRSERIALVPVTPDFLLKMEMRCQGLLDAQNAYADTMRSEDPHWAAMSGYHVGAMYRTLHHDLMAIPPTEKAKTASDKNLFFAMMHMRYRVLLEKGLEMMSRTSAFASKNPEVLPWAARAEQAKKDMEQALAEEKAVMATFPYSEEEVQKALDILEKKALAKAK